MAVSDWSPVASNNSTIDGVNIAEGCAPGNLNNAIRSVMAAIASLFNSFWLTLFSQTTASGTLNALGGAASGANADITSLQSACTATTQAVNDNSTKIATTAYVDRAAGAISTPSLGIGQTWQNMLSSRSLGSIYTNTTTKPIFVSFWFSNYGSGGSNAQVYVSGVQIGYSYVGIDSQTIGSAIQFIVPPGATYQVSAYGSPVLGGWAELR
jgi:hypothetical protein